MKIYFKFADESDDERISRSVNIWRSYRQESWLSHTLNVRGRPGTVLLKDEELARDLEYGKKQLL